MIETTQINGTIVGYDPGGNNKDGLVFLTVKNGKPDKISIKTCRNSESVICEILKSDNIIGLGADTLSCWSTGNSGWRPADTWLREKYPAVRNGVINPNYLSGAMGINGMSVLIEVAKNLRDIILSETHPKVLYYALTQKKYDYAKDTDEMNIFLSDKLALEIATKNDHEWDAVFSAYALFMGVTGKWKLDLHKLDIRENERIVKPCGKTYYYWPVELKSKPLPYTMGNAGDLIKHGLLAEFINWHCRDLHQRLSFYDPFGGRPWQEPVHDKVAERIKRLGPCPFKQAQEDIIQGYYGSSHIVAQISAANDNMVNIHSSDRNADARDDLKNTGIKLIELNGFNCGNGYSIIDCNFSDTEDTLILIDPFYDLENINDNILKKVVQKVATGKISIALYILYTDLEIKHWDKFKELQKSLTTNVSYVSLKCNAIESSLIDGESKYHSYIALYTHKNYPEQELAKFHKAVEEYSINLTRAMDYQIEYNSRINT
jgi:hypothetical protein